MLLLFLDHSLPRGLFLHSFHSDLLNREPFLPPKWVSFALYPGSSRSARLRGLSAPFPQLLAEVGVQHCSPSNNCPIGSQVCGFGLCWSWKSCFCLLGREPCSDWGNALPFTFTTKTCVSGLCSRVQPQPFLSATFPLPSLYIFLVFSVQAPACSFLLPHLWAMAVVSQLLMDFSFLRISAKGLASFTLNFSLTLASVVSSPVLWGSQWALNQEMFSKLEKVSVSFHLETVHLISIYNNFLHNTHLYFKRLLDFQECLSSYSGIGKESTPASNQDFVPSVIIAIWGNSFIGFQNEMGLLCITSAKGPWIMKTVWGKKVVYDYWQPIKDCCEPRKNQFYIFVFPFSIFMLHLSDWIRTQVELT